MISVAVGASHAARRAARSLPAPWVLVCVALIALPMLLILLHAETPPIDADELGYHLAAPKRWLQAGSLAYLPTLMHTQGSLGVEMLYTIALGVWSDTAAKLIHFVFGILTLSALFALGRRLRGPAVGVAAVTLFMIGIPQRIDILVSASAFVEMGVALECLMAIFAWLLWRRSRAPAWWLVAALCAGFAASFKLTAVLVGAALLLVDLIDGLRDGERWPILARRLAVFSGVCLAPLAPWLARNWAMTGNPLFPMASGLFPTRDWSVESGRELSLYFRYYNWGADRFGGLTLTQRVDIIRVLVVLCVVGGVVAWRMWRDPEARALVEAATLLLIGGLLTTGLYFRLLMPVLPLLYLLVCMLMSRTLSRSRVLHFALPGIILLFGARIVRNGEWRLTGPTALGRMSREAYLSARLPILPIWERINAATPPDAHVLSAAFQCATNLTSGASYYCDRPTQTTDAYLQDHLRLDTWTHFLADLKRDRIDYVVKVDGDTNVRVGPPYVAAANELAFTDRLVGGYGEPVFRAHGMSLYKLDGLYASDRPNAIRVGDRLPQRPASRTAHSLEQ